MAAGHAPLARALIAASVAPMEKTRQRYEIWVAARAAALVAPALLVALGCDPARPAPVDLELPKAYVARAQGEVEVENVRFFGHARASYLVSPSGRVDITGLRFWVDDADVVVKGIFGIVLGRERVRCTELALERPVEARLVPPDRIVVPAAAADVAGLAWEERAADGSCPGGARRISAANNSDFDLLHDPAGDRFAINTSFTGPLGDETVTIEIEMEGSFVNRPPEAKIGVGGPGLPVASIQAACPQIIDANPPYTPANDPAGLRVSLLSLSSDPDGSEGRSDITREHWIHSEGGGPWTVLGNEQLIGPVLFPLGSENRLLLQVSDRHGARSRKICDFLVLEAP